MIPPHPDVEILATEHAFKGRFALDVVTFRQRRFDGRMSEPRRWELFCRGRAAAVLPYDPVTDRVALMEQFRLPALAAGLEPVMIEIPAGLCDGDEDPAFTAKREAMEEIGLDIQEMERVGDILLTPGGSDEQCALFVGRASLPDGVRAGATGLAGEQEDIRMIVRGAESAIADAVAGRYPNSVTMIALLWLAARRTALRAQWGT